MTDPKDDFDRVIHYSAIVHAAVTDKPIPGKSIDEIMAYVNGVYAGARVINKKPLSKGKFEMLTAKLLGGFAEEAELGGYPDSVR